jgi:hypothetical protein
MRERRGGGCCDCSRICERSAAVRVRGVGVQCREPGEGVSRVAVAVSPPRQLGVRSRLVVARLWARCA